MQCMLFIFSFEKENKIKFTVNYLNSKICIASRAHAITSEWGDDVVRGGDDEVVDLNNVQ